MKYPLWKPIVLFAVILGFGLLLTVKPLKKGIDLAGGTTLVYDVQVPEGSDAGQVIDDTIAVLRSRVDPTGTRNLIWRQVAGNRIEVQMAQAPAQTQQLRASYMEAVEALTAQNFQLSALTDALSLSEDRSAAVEGLARGDSALRERLEALATGYDQLKTLDHAAREADAAYKAAMEHGQEAEAVQPLLEANVAASMAFRQARNRVRELEAAVLAENLRPEEWDAVVTADGRPGPGGASSLRQQALEALIAKHPSRRVDLERAADAYAAYEGVKDRLSDPNDLIAMLQGAGVLEMRIAAKPGEQPLDVQSYVEQLQDHGPSAGRDRPWRWFEVDNLENYLDAASASALRENPQLASALFAQREVVGGTDGSKFYVLLANTPDLAMTRAEPWEISRIRRWSDELGRPAVNFEVDARGAALLGRLTGQNVGRQMAVLLDGRVITSPVLRDRLTSGGVISGTFSPAEFDYLIRTMQAGALEGQLGAYPISIKTTGPSLGQDNLQAGVRSAIYAMIAVAVFMAGYYLFFGMVANFALLANVVVILGVMALLEATFTLPGVAGIILTIGMAVDANVLVFERIREEMARRADLALAVKIGYQRALSAIIDANLTSLLVCVVLGYTASAEVKGFAVTFGIGILATLFTSLFGAQVIIDLWILLFRPRKMHVLPTLVPAIHRLLSPNIDWFGKRYAFAVASAALLIGSLGLLYYQGVDLLAIEFRSGTQVSFELKKGQELEIGEARQRLRRIGELGQSVVQGQAVEGEEAERLRDLIELSGGTPDFGHIAEATVVTEGETDGLLASAFSVSTLIEDSQLVSEVIKLAFADVLDATATVRFSSEEIEEVREAPIYPVRSRVLGESIQQPLRSEDVSNFLGGTVTMIDGISPALSVEQMQQRLARMRQDPRFQGLGFRSHEVIGLTPGGEANGQVLYNALAVLASDHQTNYQAAPEAFVDEGGLAATEWQLIREALRHGTSLSSVSNFSSQVSNTMKQQTLAAIVLSLLGILVYIWFRFGSLRYSLAAVLGLIHDVIITLGAVALGGMIYDTLFGKALLLTPMKFDQALVAAVLAIIGYSLNDVIVIFDRVRENRGRLPRATPRILNDSINQTLSRTLLTSGTTLLAVIVLYIYGGPGVHGFAFAVLVGVVVGSYSSVAISCPLLILLGSSIEVKDEQAGSPARTGSTPAPSI